MIIAKNVGSFAIAICKKKRKLLALFSETIQMKANVMNYSPPVPLPERLERKKSRKQF